ncbi:GtrA family protein [Sphingorhabdus sp. Alg239-R122]|uniref:GtrA family protein n=1 Tax=Sphingorhabdus sp. Alg239-R122 TaxID=2305989 RepID=UPI0013DCE76C|nr:GtrA family protein [Sphingorhabdus sp. Alg239-R122]
MIEIAQKLRRITYLRYIGASVGALTVDMLVFMALLCAAIPAATASAAGYSLGIAAHWMLSSRKVFQGQVARDSAKRYRQKMLFVVSALIGLGITVGIVGAGDAFGIDPRIAKLAAIAVSFQTTYFLRNRVIFR